VSEVVAELRATLTHAHQLATTLGDSARALTATREGELERRLAESQAEFAELVERLVTAEHRANQLMNLYVATYQLYAARDPEEVQATIGEIAVDLLGAECFALLLRDSQGAACRITLASGARAGTPFDGDDYRGGDAAVDSTLRDGVPRIGRQAGPLALAVVPLRVQDAVVGALVIWKLFDHKPALSTEDRDLLDLLAAHAASAFYAARAFATTARRLQSLESLVQLLRSEP
jgi:hypothetical protein